MLSYAVIGTGWITQSFIDGANLDGRMALAGVCSRSEETGRAFAEKNGCHTVFTSVEALAGSSIPAVYIASPNALHARQAEILLQAGKHVLCEKPITVTPSELDYLQTLAGEHGVIYAEAIMYMFHPVRPLLKKAISEIGVITSAHLDFSQLSSKYAAYKAGNLPNIFNPKMATGCLEDLGVYCVYPALDLFGKPDAVKATASFMQSGADGSGGAFLEYPDKTVTLTYSKLGQDYAGSQIFGDLGTVILGSVSKLTEVKIRWHGGEETVLSGDIEKAELMGNEATGWRKLIEAPAENAAFYEELKKAALETSLAMAEIREKAGIRFPYEAIR